MKPPNPIPAGAKRLYLYRHWCGDEACNCHHFEIWADLPAEEPGARGWRGREQAVSVWESSWSSPDNYGVEKFAEEMLEEVRPACKHYGIEVDFTKSVWEWEGERKL